VHVEGSDRVLPSLVGRKGGKKLEGGVVVLGRVCKSCVKWVMSWEQL